MPTPPPGTGVPVTVPAPDPLQYPAASGSVISSAQWNSNFWKNYNDINAIASSLNGCGYSTGTGVTSVSATSPLSASIGSCVPGVGTNLTLSLGSVANYVATGNVNAYSWSGIASTAGHTEVLGSQNSSIYGTNCNGFQIADTTASTQLFCSDGAGNVASTGANTAPVFNAVGTGTSFSVPWNGNSSPSDEQTHVEHGVALTGSLSAGACSVGSLSYGRPYSSGDVPFVGLVVSQSGGGVPIEAHLTSPPTATGFSFAVCSLAVVGGPFSIALYYSALGE